MEMRLLNFVVHSCPQKGKECIPDVYWHPTLLHKSNRIHASRTAVEKTLSLMSSFLNTWISIRCIWFLSMVSKISSAASYFAQSDTSCPLSTMHTIRSISILRVFVRFLDRHSERGSPRWKRWQIRHTNRSFYQKVFKLSLSDVCLIPLLFFPAPGYEYKDEQGCIQGPFPAIAFFTWGLKGLLPPTITLRRPGRREFRPLSYFESEILIVARIQLTNQMLYRKEWFYLDASQQVQGPFSAADMTGYVATRYMRESVKFYGRAIQQDNIPPPSAASPEFHSYGHLLDKTMKEYREEIKVHVIRDSPS